MTIRPDPAMRRPVVLDGDSALKTLKVITVNQREVECQACWNRTVLLHVGLHRDIFLRATLLVVTACALLCAWVAWNSHSDLATAHATMRLLEK